MKVSAENRGVWMGGAHKNRVQGPEKVGAKRNCLLKPLKTCARASEPGILRCGALRVWINP